MSLRLASISLMLTFIFAFTCCDLSEAENVPDINPAGNYAALQKTLEAGEGEVKAISAAYLSLLAQLKAQIGYETLIVYKDFKHDDDDDDDAKVENCAFLDSSIMFQVPTLILNDEEIKNFTQYFSKRTLVLRCEPANWQLQTDVGLQNITKGLRYVSYLPTPNNKDGQGIFIRNYCVEIFKAGVFEAIILLDDFSMSGYYFICHYYPEAHVEQCNFLQQSCNRNTTLRADIFGRPFYNMHGAILWTQPDQLPPRSIVYHDAAGQIRMTGYVANLIELFAKHQNATLRYRYDVNGNWKFANTSHVSVFDKNCLDIAAALIMLRGDRLEVMTSYPYDVNKYCLMIPLPKPIEYYQIYSYMMTPLVLAIIFVYLMIYSSLLLQSIDGKLGHAWPKALLNFEMIRALLAQTFQTVPQPRALTKFIIIQISFSCYLINNMYLAFINSYLTQPPLMPFITDAKAAHRAGLRLLFPRMELPLLDEIVHGKELKKLLLVVDEYKEYDRIRGSMDMRYMYPVTDRRWQIFHENQKIFQHRIFYFHSMDCIFPTVLLSFPMRAGLPYRDIFNQFLLQAHASGLVQHWTSMGFYDMLRFGLLQINDQSIYLFPTEARALKLGDFYWIWLGFGCTIMMSILAFLLELLRVQSQGYACVRKTNYAL